MMQCFYSQQDKKTKEMQYYLCHSLGTESLRSEKRFRSFHMSPMKTFISKRIRCAAQSAEEMITDHFNEWAHDFVHEISALVDALRIASPTAGKHMLPQLSKSSLPIFWVAVEGKDGKTGCQQFAGAMQLAAFRSLTGLGSEHLVIVQDVLRHGASVSVHESALALSHTFCHYGNLGLALVHVCISCESVLSDAYRRFLIMRGVSNKKYKDSERDITFSQLLNLHFAAMFQLDEMKDSIDVLRIINWARQQRNDRVHTGEISKDVTESEVIKAIEAAEHLVSFVVSKSKDFRV